MMIALDVVIAILAVVASFVVAYKWQTLKSAGTLLGVSLLLLGLWVGATLYIGDFLYMTIWYDAANPEASMQAMVDLHSYYSWYVNTTSTVLIFLGLGIVVFQLTGRIRERETALGSAINAKQAQSRFLAKMSHELRTPLNAIIGFSDILKSELFTPHSDPRYKEYSGDINSSARHLLDLINDILDLSKVSEGKEILTEEVVDPVELALDVNNTLRQTASAKNIRLDFSEPKQIFSLFADRRRVKQMLFNLVSNAIKFTGDGGIVRTEIFLNQQGGLDIKVSDNGVGIAEEDIPIVMEAFGQVRPESLAVVGQTGTGLGLYLVSQLIQLHGGTMALESKPGKGTSVTLSFPLARLELDTAA